MVIPMQFNSLDELYRLQKLAVKADAPVYVHSPDDAVMVDARSFIGLFTLDFTKPVNVVTDSAYVARKLGAGSLVRG